MTRAMQETQAERSYDWSCARHDAGLQRELVSAHALYWAAFFGAVLSADYPSVNEFFRIGWFCAGIPMAVIGSDCTLPKAGFSAQAKVALAFVVGAAGQILLPNI